MFEWENIKKGFKAMNEDKNAVFLKAVGIFLAIIFIIAFILNILNTGELVVTSNPVKAKIVVNNKTYITPKTVRLKPGVYSITAYKEGLPTQIVQANVILRKKTNLLIDLTKTQDLPEPVLAISGDDPLLTKTDHFEVGIPDDEVKYDISVSLFAIFNAGVNGPPIEEQEKVYFEQLKAYKNEALEYIKSQNIDPATLRIYWLPEKAKDL